MPEPPFDLLPPVTGSGMRSVTEPPFALALGTDPAVGAVVPVAMEPGGPGGFYGAVIGCGGTVPASCP